MHRGICRRCLHTARTKTGQREGSSNDGVPVREILAKIRKQREVLREGAATGDRRTSKDTKEQVVGVRELVISRSSEFSSVLNKLSVEEYMNTPVRKRLQDHFQGQSVQELLKETQSSPAKQQELLAKLAEAEASDFDENMITDEYSAAGSLAADEYSVQARLYPGDLVEYWPDKGMRRTAIILRRPDESSGTRYMILDDRGKIDFANPNRFRFVLQEFYDKTLIKQHGLMMQNDPVFVPLRQALKKFKGNVRDVSADNAQKLTNIYNDLPAQLTKRSSVISSIDVCKAVFGETTQAQLYAVFEQMTTDRVHFLPDATLHVTVPLFSTRSKAEVKAIEQVLSWTRDRSSQFLQFIDRARKIAMYGKDITTDISGPPTPTECPIHFSLTDMVFIDFMIKSCLERMDRPENEFYTTPVSLIVKTLDFFPGRRIDRSAVHAALKEMGILTPWDLNLRRLQAAALPNQGSSQSADEAEAFFDANFAQNQVESLARLGLEDRCDALRHDFGQLPVYAIDGDDASELDDGLSIDGDWIHVHIADPSSFIPYGSKLADIAAFKVETTYFTEQIYTMLPRHLAMTHFSLGSAPATPSMTTSIRLDSDGKIMDMKVRPSVIRNVIKTTYDVVDSEVFALKRNTFTLSQLSVNWQQDLARYSVMSRNLTNLTDLDKQNIRQLQEYLKRARKYRYDNGLIDFFNVERTTTVQPRTLASLKHDDNVPVFYSGRPGIATSVLSASDSAAVGLVSEAAILANRATASYAAERSIPIIYRALESSLNADELAHVLSLRNATGRVRLEEVRDLLGKFGATRMSLEQRPADMLGLPEGYTHATSPLRRYVDMIAQWHIQAHLRKEAYPVDLEKTMSHIVRRGKALKRIDKTSKRHWVLQLLHQKMERGESLQFEATVYNNNNSRKHPSEATLQGVGERCLVRRSAGDPVMKLGSNVQVIVEELDLMDNVIYVRRIDLASKAMQITPPTAEM